MTKLTELELKAALASHEILSDTSNVDMSRTAAHKALIQKQSGSLLIVLTGERPTSWNQFYAGTHWTERKREADRVHTLVYAYLFDFPDLSVFHNPVDITVTAYFDHHPQDASNICAKLYEDALIGLLINGDGPKWVSSMKTESRIDKENPRVEIRIQEVGK